MEAAAAIQSTSDPEIIRRILDDYATFAGIERPYTLIVDGSSILQGGCRLDALQLVLQDPEARIYTTACVKKELAVVGNYYPLPDSLNLDNIEECSCDHEKGTFHENCIEKLIGKYNLKKFIVVTALRKYADLLLVDGVIKLPIIVLENGNFSLMDPIQAGKTIDCHQLMASYKRLMHRVKFFKFAERETGVGARSFFQAIADYTGIVGHAEVKRRLVHQISMHRGHYFPPGKHSVYAENLAKPGWWPDKTVCQAVADAFGCRLVILLSHEDQFFFEWCPYYSNYTDNLDIIYLSCLDGYRFGALYDQVDNHMAGVFDVDNRYQRRGPKLCHLSFKVCKGEYQFDYSNDLDDFRNDLLDRVLNARLNRRLRTFRFTRSEVHGDV